LNLLMFVHEAKEDP